jgi:hypothetical protein
MSQGAGSCGMQDGIKNLENKYSIKNDLMRSAGCGL